MPVFGHVFHRPPPVSNVSLQFRIVELNRIIMGEVGGGKNVIGYFRGVARRVRMYSWFFVSSYIIGNNGNVFKKRRDVRLCFNGIVSTTE